jgi:hypothetical protein
MTPAFSPFGSPIYLANPIGSIDSTASRILALRAARPSHRVPALRFIKLKI